MQPRPLQTTTIRHRTKTHLKVTESPNETSSMHSNIWNTQSGHLLGDTTTASDLSPWYTGSPCRCRLVWRFVSSRQLRPLQTTRTYTHGQNTLENTTANIVHHRRHEHIHTNKAHQTNITANIVHCRQHEHTQTNKTYWKYCRKYRSFQMARTYTNEQNTPENPSRVITSLNNVYVTVCFSSMLLQSRSDSWYSPNGQYYIDYLCDKHNRMFSWRVKQHVIHNPPWFSGSSGWCLSSSEVRLWINRTFS